jgi:Transposase family tnp2
MLYQRPNFEKMLKSSGIQKENIYSDIYDGKVWKTFSSSDGSPFFTLKTATTHLGLLINLNWFQPFTYTQHSTGAIYASICNLLRSERNKPENIIYLSFLSGLKEVGLERINHYLAPIVDELLELWNGWRIPKTHECPEGLDIKVALIIGSSDTPATQKLFGHRSAVMKCYRCDKRNTYSHEYKKSHYG